MAELREPTVQVVVDGKPMERSFAEELYERYAALARLSGATVAQQLRADALLDALTRPEAVDA